ncbi:ABC transporter ATP-binding protein [Rubrobacter xylanophilus]|uniref:ABC transporter ATP-binding protein n=1 Tax=Rubrobacter xylanophilus TaxID=49319 RepID=A0A510HPN4_9ACTN|nr:ABC transporter ATP-binding protein [Rubrobacter xylanophilus]BBL80777.1 ABC transporter ATP-binding protein [Rubrobacter xylanophilus]
MRLSFGGVAAVDGATLSVEPGKITALIGPNGAGKTTFFNVITGFYKPDGGEIFFDGDRITGKPPHAIARRGLVRTFQLTKALARMTVLDNMMLAAPGQTGEKLFAAWVVPWVIRKQEAANREKALELLELFNLMDKKDEYAATLSGGQRKLLELARALMMEPRMILLDEPMAGVNPTLGARLLEHVQKLRDEGMTFVLVEHDMDVVMNVSEKVIVMANGRVITEGSPEEVRTNQEVIDAYLGAGGGAVDEAIDLARREEESGG